MSDDEKSTVGKFMIELEFMQKCFGQDARMFASTVVSKTQLEQQTRKFCTLWCNTFR